MRSEKYIWAIFVVILMTVGCSDEEKGDPDPDPDPTEETANDWIAEKMREVYLWNDEIPNDNLLNFSSESDEFFTSLLSDSDGKTRRINGRDYRYYYSTIEEKNSLTKAISYEEYTYGFEFIYGYLDENSIVIQVLYVLPDSPAEEGGLERGDIILTINGSAVSYSDSEVELLTSPSNLASLDLNVAKRANLENTMTIRLTARNNVADNPVFTYKTIPYGGKNIGYLLYNHFTASLENNGTDGTYNNSMRNAFAELKNENPDEFILDLRYNGGGLVTCAQLLATMLAPSSIINGNTTFCNLVDNKGIILSVPFDSKLITSGAQGANLDLSKLYVITSDRTASASELVINGLLPHMDVIILGEQTEGKNVGSIAYENDEYDWILHPIVSMLSNSEGDSDYADGFTPDVDCDEYDDVIQYDLGDEREYLLKVALNYIATGIFPQNLSSSLRSTETILKPIYHSLDRKQVNSVILPTDLTFQ